jgi:hypothetical protein
MSYLTQDDIATNLAMQARVAQAAAEQGTDDPDEWTFTHRRTWAAAPGWDDAWESAKVTHPEPDYDPGSDEGVITDTMILAQVQAMPVP